MILVFLLIAVAVLLATCIYLFLRIRKYQYDAEMQYGNSQFWYGKWRESEEGFIKLSKQYDALDQGNDEIEENYQQEILTLHDKYEEQFNRSRLFGIELDRLLPVVEHHNTHCLPTLVMPDGFYPASAAPSEG